MISMKSRRILLASLTSLLLVSVCSAEQQAAATVAVVNETVEATVNGVAISKNRVDMIAKQRGDQAETPESRRSIIDQLTMQTLVAEEAVKKGLDKSAEVADQIALIRQSVLANAYVQDFILNNPVSDETLKVEYARIKSTISGTEYKARHILVATESEAKDIIAKLKKNPNSFSKLAMAKSKDTGSKVKGGDLGWFDPSAMVPEFGAAVSTLGKGKLTAEPVKTQFGYHIILLEDSRPIEAPAFDEIKGNLAQQLQQQNLKKQLDDLKAAAKIELVEAPAEAAK